MMLQELVRLAESEKLIADPDFEFKAVAWIVRLQEDGSFIGVEDNRLNLNDGQVDKKGKPLKAKWIGRDVLIPLFPTGRAGIKPKAAFLVDMAKFVFGRELLEERNDGSLVPYVERFRHLVVECETATADSSVAAVRIFLDQVLANHSPELPKVAGPSELFMFRVGADAEPVHLRPNVQIFWKQLRAKAPEDAEVDDWTTCLVTGVPIVGKPPLFPLIKGVPGAGTMGSGLLPFNGPSSRTWSSFGLEGNANAPVSRLAAEAAATALNRLADPRPTDGNGGPLPVRRIRLSNDTIVVFWSSSPEPEVTSVLDTLPNLLDPGDITADVGNLIASYRSGTFRPLHSPAAFYAATLTGTTGRIVVRDWFETSVAQLQSNVAVYFEQLAVFRPFDSDEGKRLGLTPPFSMRDVKLTVFRELDDVPAPFAREWLRLIWNPRVAVSPSIVQRVINRIKIAFSQGESMPASAAAILQLQTSREGNRNMKAYLNEDHPNPAYHCGRMLAVLDFAQQRALGTTNTTNVRRMLGAIITAPALYIARVRKLTETAYLPKCKGKWGKYLQSRIQSIGGTMKDAFPALLSLRDQSVFFLGMDHERSYLDTHPAEKYKVQAVNGKWVQSAGEANVVKGLIALGHPFEYEPGIKLIGDNYRVPDFMISSLDVSQRVFIEYLGMRDDLKYEERWQKKIVEFTAFGLKPIEDGGGPSGKLIVIDGDGRDYAGILATLERYLGRAGTETIQEIEDLSGDDQ